MATVDEKTQLELCRQTAGPATNWIAIIWFYPQAQVRGDCDLYLPFKSYGLMATVDEKTQLELCRQTAGPAIMDD
ncbi:hypothetical protein M514_24691 [Trichuris suis]|uniref:Uncharacterized protein n=1 Tax=Trichuris suis TaxID=68888 RepID=A0A085N0V8_9BILA|nr:hypothetical protein M514_24691 [Trichuris suis]